MKSILIFFLFISMSLQGQNFQHSIYVNTPDFVQPYSENGGYFEYGVFYEDFLNVDERWNAGTSLGYGLNYNIATFLSINTGLEYSYSRIKINNNCGCHYTRGWFVTFINHLTTHSLKIPLSMTLSLNFNSGSSIYLKPGITGQVLLASHRWVQKQIEDLESGGIEYLDRRREYFDLENYHNHPLGAQYFAELGYVFNLWNTDFFISAEYSNDLFDWKYETIPTPRKGVLVIPFRTRSLGLNFGVRL